MAAAKKSSDDSVERLEKMIEGMLDKREQRARDEKDPKARFDRVMGRLESFLDGLEEGERKEGKPKSGEGDAEKDEGGGFLDVILGGK